VQVCKKLHQNCTKIAPVKDFCTGERFLHRWNSGEPFFGWGTIFWRGSLMTAFLRISIVASERLLSFCCRPKHSLLARILSTGAAISVVMSSSKASSNAIGDSSGSGIGCSLKDSARALLNSFVNCQEASGEHVSQDILRVLKEEAQLMYGLQISFCCHTSEPLTHLIVSHCVLLVILYNFDNQTGLRHSAYATCSIKTLFSATETTPTCSNSSPGSNSLCKSHRVIGSKRQTIIV
jgi:hypothetical protein